MLKGIVGLLARESDGLLGILHQTSESRPLEPLHLPAYAPFYPDKPPFAQVPTLGAGSHLAAVP